MVCLVELWLQELSRGALKVFVNPLFYWIFILVVLAGYQRIKNERQQFGVKVFDLFSEWKYTWFPAILTGLILSIIFAGVGLVYSYGTIIVLSVMMIILSIHLRFTLLSPSYTIGLTYIVLLFAPVIIKNQNYIPESYFTDINYLGLALLLGVMLIVEAFFIRRVKRDETFPRLLKSERGIWIGEHQIKKLTMIPLIFLVPGGVIESFAPYWPLISINDTTYGLVLFPFLLGFSHRVRASIAPLAAKHLSKKILLLGILVLAISVTGYYLKGLSLLALLIALFGREFITYRFRTQEKQKNAFFKPEEVGLRVIGIIPGTPAERLDIQVGEVVYKVNDKRIYSSDGFYEALQTSGAYFKLDILDDNGEVRFVQSAFYESDHYRLGLLFVEKPHRTKQAVNEG